MKTLVGLVGYTEIGLLFALIGVMAGCLISPITAILSGNFNLAENIRDCVFAALFIFTLILAYEGQRDLRAWLRKINFSGHLKKFLIAV